jgi:hypothetical protein
MVQCKSKQAGLDNQNANKLLWTPCPFDSNATCTYGLCIAYLVQISQESCQFFLCGCQTESQPTVYKRKTTTTTKYFIPKQVRIG